MDMAKLRSLGITVDVLLHHFVYITEFCYGILEPSQEGRTFYILDMENVSFLSIDADVKEFLRRAIKICGDHCALLIHIHSSIPPPLHLSFVCSFLLVCLSWSSAHC